MLRHGADGDGDCLSANERRMTPTADPTMTGLKRLYILTGEPSGDAHAAAVVRALKARAPEVEVRGMGGDALAAEGTALIEHIRNTSVMGFAEVIRKLASFDSSWAASNRTLQPSPPTEYCSWITRV